jgi:hypothetical protein
LIGRHEFVDEQLIRFDQFLLDIEDREQEGSGHSSAVLSGGAVVEQGLVAGDEAAKDGGEGRWRRTVANCAPPL